MASNFFPILSSSPPPLDDEDSLENDDDDDEFGTYAAVHDSPLDSPVSGVPAKHAEADYKQPHKSHLFNQKNSITTLIPPNSVHSNTFISDDYSDFADFTSSNAFDEISECNAAHANNIDQKSIETVSNKTSQETSTKITFTCSTNIEDKPNTDDSTDKFSVCNDFKAFSQQEFSNEGSDLVNRICRSVAFGSEVEACSIEEEEDELDFGKRSPITRQLSPRSEQQDNTSQESVPDSGLCNSSQHSETSPPPLSEGVFSDTSPEKEVPIKNVDNTDALLSVCSKLDSTDLKKSFDADISKEIRDTWENSIQIDKTVTSRSNDLTVISEQCLNHTDKIEYGAFIIHESKPLSNSSVHDLESPSHLKENCVLSSSDLISPVSQSEDFSLIQDMSNNTCLSSDQSHFETARTSPSSSGSSKDGILQDISSFPEEITRTCTYKILKRQSSFTQNQHSLERTDVSDSSFKMCTEKSELTDSIDSFAKPLSEKASEELTSNASLCDKEINKECDNFHHNSEVHLATDNPSSVKSEDISLEPNSLPAEDDFGDFETVQYHSPVDDFANFEQAQEELSTSQEFADFEKVKDNLSDALNEQEDNFADFESVSFGHNSLQSKDEIESDNFDISSENMPQVETSNSRAAQLIIAAFPKTPESVVEDSSESLKENDYESILLEQHSKSRRLWDKLQDLDQAPALHFQWGISHTFQQMLRSVSIDYHSILRTSSVPIFACSLQLLEPTKGPLSFNKHEIEEKLCQTQSPKEPIPPVHFDWNGSGLINPLDSGHATSTLMDLSFLSNSEALPSKPSISRPFSLEDEFLGPTPELSSVEKIEKPPLLEKLLSLSASTSLPQSKKGLRPSTVSGEASQVLNKLPDLSFMRAKVLMFPLRNNT